MQLLNKKPFSKDVVYFRYYGAITRLKSMTSLFMLSDRVKNNGNNRNCPGGAFGMERHPRFNLKFC